MSRLATARSTVQQRPSRAHLQQMHGVPSLWTQSRGCSPTQTCSATTLVLLAIRHAPGEEWRVWFQRPYLPPRFPLSLHSRVSLSPQLRDVPGRSRTPRTSRAEGVLLLLPRRRVAWGCVCWQDGWACCHTADDLTVSLVCFSTGRCASSTTGAEAEIHKCPSEAWGLLLTPEASGVTHTA